MSDPRLVVASVPAAHPYVRHLDHLDAGHGTGPRRLVDPDPLAPERPAAGPWWPPAMLRPEWARSHDFDLMHVHFGFDERTPAELTALVDTLRRRGRGLVLTVHDLRSPHQVDHRVLDAQLDVLVPAADEVLTLTAGAAAEIARRWHRRATVVPHPHVVPLDHLERVRAARSLAGAPPVRRVGMAVKSLRRNTDPARLLPALLRATGPDVRLVVSIHREVHAHPSTPEAAALVQALDRAHADDRLELVVHEPLADLDLWTAVAGLDVAVLPYRFGTHSGWLEMCHDLGTSVVAPSFGHYADQGADAVYDAGLEWVDDDSLVAAVHRALADRAGRLPGLDAPARRDQRRDVAAAHDVVYARARRHVA